MSEWSTIDDVIAPGGFLARLELGLRQRFSPPLRPELIQRCLLECLAEFDDAPVQQFVPILVERMAVDQLSALVARSEFAKATPSNVVPIAAARMSQGVRSPN
jgi:hypothetical protein